MAEIKCIVVTPEETAFEKDASYVVIPLYDGEFGIAQNHSPMIGRLGFGELRITSGNQEVERYYVDGGFVQVADNVVTLLTSRVVPVAEVDEEAAHEQLKDAMNRPAHTPELLQVRDRNVQQARAQIRLAAKS
ncbi:MAG: ATP synthase F1 subunit epsilon [Planctomycetaceae bacterium]|nr:ATP synthase F1 subunit epsilon [Planctomycetaceae bacterium]